MGLTWQSNWKFFWDWVKGRGPRDRIYGPKNIETKEMQKSPGAAELRDRFYRGYCQTFHHGGYGTVQAYEDTTINPMTLDWSNTAAQVGGFAGASVINNGNGTATFIIPNTAGTYSFFLHLVPDRKSPTGVMSNIQQLFIWTEPIEKCKCQQ